VVVAVAAVPASFLPMPLTALALVAALVAAAVLDREVLRLAWRAGLVLALVFAAALAGAVVAWSAGPERGLAIGTALLVRMLTLLVLTTLAARQVDADAILAATARLRLERLGLVLSLALNCLPHLTEAAHDAWLALRVRRPDRRPRPRDLARLAEVILAHTARIADDAAAAAALRGHAALTLRRPTLPPVPQMVVLTGTQDSGKTTALEQVAQRLGDSGQRTIGFLQLSARESGRKVGFRLRDLVTGREVQLAERVGHELGEHGTGFRFFADGFQLARRALAGSRSGAVVIVDELGPVELRGGGHMPAVRSALAKGPRAVVVTVRRHLIPVLLAQLTTTTATIVDLETSDDPVGDVLAALAVGPAQRE
jgi:nucleoside-triphosphatase THEP1